MSTSTDINVEQWKIKQLVKRLGEARGNGTSMISLIIPPKDQIARVQKMLTDEYGTASNIKSRVNRPEMGWCCIVAQLSRTRARKERSTSTLSHSSQSTRPCTCATTGSTQTRWRSYSKTTTRLALLSWMGMDACLPRSLETTNTFCTNLMLTCQGSIVEGGNRLHALDVFVWRSVKIM